MKVAVATENGRVAAHFGRCPEYTIAVIDDGKLVNSNRLPNPGHEPGFLPKYLAEHDVGCIIAGGMGPRAQNLFAERGIEVVIGVTGPVDQVIDDFLTGRLKVGESLCAHGDNDHAGCDDH